MTQLVYGIFNSIEEKWYIGSTRQPNNKRRNEHFSKLRNNTHENKKLQNAANLHGIGSFQYYVLEEFEDTPNDYTKLLKLEAEYIKDLDSFMNGYNNTDNTYCAMFTYEVRAQHWGELHGGSKYTNDQIEQVFDLLYSTTLTYPEIHKVSQVDINTISYIKTGGHQWVHLKYLDKSVIVVNRFSKKQKIGIVYENSDILEAFELLLSYPNMSFEVLSNKCSVKLETISALSTGRQFRDLIICHFGSMAEEYFKLGKLGYSKKYTPPTWIEDADRVLNFLVREGYMSRDKVSSALDIKTTSLARSILELDINTWSQILYWSKIPFEDIKVALLIVSDRPRASITTKEKKMILLDKFTKDDRNVR